MTSGLVVRKLKIEDSQAIANLHFDSFKGFFLTSLGVSFLKIFYNAVLSNSKGLGVGIFYKGQLLGFAVGTSNKEGFYKTIFRSSGIDMFLKAFPKLITNPSKINRLVVTLMSSNKADYSASPSLLSICVSGDTSFKGLGSKLIREFEKELAQNKYSTVVLTTDKHNNDYVNQFYIRNQYLCIHSFSQGRREMNFYYKKLEI